MKLFLIILMFVSSFAFAQYEDISTLEAENKTIQTQTHRSRALLISFGERAPIHLNKSKSDVLLWHLNNLLEIMDIADENNINVDYISNTVMMYVGPYTSKRISFRVNIRNDGSYSARIGVLEYEALEYIFLSREELQQLISNIETTIQRYNEIISQIQLLNEEIEELY